jgi:hypothetical protein
VQEQARGANLLAIEADVADSKNRFANLVRPVAAGAVRPQHFHPAPRDEARMSGIEILFHPRGARCLTAERTGEIISLFPGLSWPIAFSGPQLGQRRLVRADRSFRQAPRPLSSRRDRLTAQRPPRLLGTVEPLQGFIQSRRHLVLAHIEQ